MRSAKTYLVILRVRTNGSVETAVWLWSVWLSSCSVADCKTSWTHANTTNSTYIDDLQLRYDFCRAININIKPMCKAQLSQANRMLCKRRLSRHAVSVCLSVCPSRSWILSKQINVSSKKFFTSGIAPHHSSFSVPNGMALFRRELAWQGHWMQVG